MTQDEAFETVATVIELLRAADRDTLADELEEAYDVFQDTIDDLREEAYSARLKDDTYP